MRLAMAELWGKPYAKPALKAQKQKGKKARNGGYIFPFVRSYHLTVNMKLLFS